MMTILLFEGMCKDGKQSFEKFRAAHRFKLNFHIHFAIFLRITWEDGGRLYPFNSRSQLLQSRINILVTSVDLLDVLNNAFPFRAERSNQQRNACAYIRTAHRYAPQFLFAFQSDHYCAMRIAKNDLSAHIDQFVNKE